MELDIPLARLGWFEAEDRRAGLLDLLDRPALAGRGQAAAELGVGVNAPGYAGPELARQGRGFERKSLIAIPKLAGRATRRAASPRPSRDRSA